MDNYKNKYDAALKRARELSKTVTGANYEYIFPELKESEDERIKQEILHYIKSYAKLREEKIPTEWFEYLEKQGEQKPTDKIEPKFKVGNWIIGDEGIFEITQYKDEYGYELTGTTGYVAHSISSDYVESYYHLWTVQDAKDGDVLVCNINKAEIGGDIEKLPNITPTICIYQNVVKDKDFIHSYCSLYNGSSLVLQNRMYYNTFVYNIQPATKEQRELLFQKIAEAGCKWDAEKKELRGQILKITPKFCVGQLITDDNGTWYEIRNIKCLDDWYYEVYDISKNSTHLELCSIIDEKFRENRFVDEIKKMMRD